MVFQDPTDSLNPRYTARETIADVEAPVPAGFAGRTGQPCSLQLRLEPSDAVIRMIGEMAHVEPGRIGIRRSEIDLESMAHLRRLVELNVGDASLLDREFDALVNDRL